MTPFDHPMRNRALQFLQSMPDDHRREWMEALRQEYIWATTTLSLIHQGYEEQVSDTNMIATAWLVMLITKHGGLEA